MNVKDRRIETAAGKALAEWEAVFSSGVLSQARVLAEESGADLVTLGHFQQAAETAVAKLLANIRNGLDDHGQKAA